MVVERVAWAWRWCVFACACACVRCVGGVGGGAFGASGAASKCRLSEFLCDNGRCLSWDRFCDGIDHCGDASDEPRHCSRCNRTYYGETERTYLLELHRPRDDRLPFVCRVSFQAAGQDFGDIVQVTFEGFRVGRLNAGPPPSCPDGHVHITEAGRPDAGGQWCGSAWGRAVYFSEGNGVTLTLHVLHLPSEQTGYSFEYRLAYRFLKQRDALVRYGLPDRPFFRGTLLSGTYCSLIFDNCRHRWCRLQSPNFPGVYPRNTTCYYAIRQHLVPVGMHALIRVSQPLPHLVYVHNHAQDAASSPGGGAQGAGPQGTARAPPPGPAAPGPAAQGPAASSSSQASPLLSTIKVDQHCPDGKDHVTIYDGYTVRDPVLLRFCGAGAVPPVTSSRNEILVEFVSSAVDAFPPPGPTHLVWGFQLDVQVELVEQERAPLAPPPPPPAPPQQPHPSSHGPVSAPPPPPLSSTQSCHFLLTSRPGGRRGVLLSPPQSLPKNASCRYTLRGLPQQVIWLAPVKFHVESSVVGVSSSGECGAQVQVWDGREASNASSSGSRLLARMCRDGQQALSCDHALLDGLPRPCLLPRESFLSSGPHMLLLLSTTQPTALRPVSFRFLYEFVQLGQEYQPQTENTLHGTGVVPGGCDRVFRSEGKALEGGRFESPSNVFLFGRGGNSELSCVFRFEAQPAERVKLALSVLLLGEQPCVNTWDPHLGRHRCSPQPSTTHPDLLAFPSSRLEVWELPWNDTRVARECFCNATAAPLSFASTAPVVELTWNLRGMTPADDAATFRLEGAFEFLPSPPCARTHRLSASSGQIRLRRPSASTEDLHCESLPWLLLPRPGRFLYLSARGHLISSHAGGSSEESRSCPTRNRVAVYSGGEETQLLSVFCPDPRSHTYVEVFSLGWNMSGVRLGLRGEPPLATTPLRQRALLVDFVAKEPGAYTLRWLELAREWSSLGASWEDSGTWEGEGEAAEAEEQRRMRAWQQRGRVDGGETWGGLRAGCTHRCPELHGCIASALWCDGQAHCPSAFDESLEQCAPFSFLSLRPPTLYYVVCAAAAALLALLAAAAGLGVWLGRGRRRRRGGARGGARHKASPLVPGTSSSSSSSFSAAGKGGRGRPRTTGGAMMRRSATDEEFLGGPEVLC